MRRERGRAGFTLIELMIIVIVIGILVGIGGFAMSGWISNQRVRGSARSIGDLFSVARSEAIRLRDNHIVFLNLDASGNLLQNDAGEAVAALVIRDENGNGAPDAGEYVTSMPFDATGSVSWGSTFALTGGAEIQAPNDNPATSFPLPAGFGCCTFTQPGGGAARWVAFLPDGMPRSFSVGPFDSGPVGSGNGAVYVTNGDRDYAVVLAALGGVRVHLFDQENDQWRR